MKTTNHRQHRQRGTELLEFAIVLPLLAFLAFAISEGAAFIRIHQVLNNAAREGARISILPNYEPDTASSSVNAQHVADIQNAALNYAANNGITTSDSRCPGLNVTVNQVYPIANGTLTIVGSQVVASCTYQFKFMPTLPGFSVPNSVNLKGRAVFSNLY